MAQTVLYTLAILSLLIFLALSDKWLLFLFHFALCLLFWHTATEVRVLSIKKKLQKAVFPTSFEPVRCWQRSIFTIILKRGEELLCELTMRKAGLSKPGEFKKSRPYFCLFPLLWRVSFFLLLCFAIR